MTEKIQLGEYLRGKPEGMSDGTYFDILGDTMLFVLIVSNPNKKIIEEFQHGETQFALLEEDGIIYFLVKLGDLPWVDSPYNKYMYTQPVEMVKLEEGKGYSVILILADGNDSKTKGMRIVSLHNEFSNLLMNTVDNQPYNSKFDESVEEKYAKYSSSEEMSKIAIKEGIELPRLKRNNFNIGYFYSNEKEFKTIMDLTRVHCDDCNVLLENEDIITVVPFLNSAYCKDCGKEMIEDCKAIDKTEEKYQKYQEEYFQNKFRIK